MSTSRDLPDGWSWAKLGDVATIESDLVEPRAHAGSPHIAPNHIESSTGRLLPYTTIAEDRVTSQKHLFRPGHILYSKIRPYLAKAVIVDFDGLCSADMYPIASGIDVHYLHRWLISPEFTELVTESQGRTVLPKVNQQDLLRKLVPVPPLCEQKRIARMVESLSDRSRRAREALDAIPPLLDRLRQSVLAAAFRGDLTADWREKHPDVEPAEVLLQRIRAERRRRWEEAELAGMKAKGKVPGDDRWKERYEEPAPADASDLPELPEGWSWASLSELSWDAGYGTSERCDRDAAGPPVLRIPNIMNGTMDLRDLKRAVHGATLKPEEALSDGDLLIVRTNGSRGLIGRAAMIHTALPERHYFASYLIRYRLVPTDMLPTWVGGIWGAPQLRSRVDAMAATSAGQYNVSLSNLGQAPIPIPPSAERRELLRILDGSRQRIARVHKTVREAQEQLVFEDRSILAKAFRGELVPQDPSDEPASVLLERLRAERAAADAGAGPARRAGRKRKVPSPAAG